MKRVISVYGGDIDDEILYYQRLAFAHAQIPLEQIKFDPQGGRFSHGQALNETLDSLKFEEVAIFDVDAFCISPTFLQRVLTLARNGFVVGAAQNSNHLKGSEFDYIGPCFISFSKNTWVKNKGEYGFIEVINRETNEGIMDVGEYFYHQCYNNSGHEFVKLIYPSSVNEPKWCYNKAGCRFGVGTWFDGVVYHQFECRLNGGEGFINEVKKLITF